MHCAVFLTDCHYFEASIKFITTILQPFNAMHSHDIIDSLI